MPETLIKVEGVYKKFCKSLKRSMIYGSNDVLRDFIGYPSDRGRLRKGEFWALQDINFELKRGETLGLIGLNGCGKTTLLRLINGIFPPDKGKITINGRIGALIAVGAGFHPHMTGRENIYLNGSILGMSKAQITRKFEEIVAFAEIGDFIDAPVATYSSGMTVRLGFAIAIHCEPDILLVDEILAVGDKNFQIKCYQEIYKLKKNGVSIILVAHNEYTIIENTQNALYLRNGVTEMFGNTVDTVKFYINSLLLDSKSINSQVGEKSISKKADIQDVDFNQESIAFGEKLTVKIKIKVNESIVHPVIGLNFYSDNQYFACINNEYNGPAIEKLEQSDKEFVIEIENFIMPIGKYRSAVTISEESTQNLIDWKENNKRFSVIKRDMFRGDIKLNALWQIR